MDDVLVTGHGFRMRLLVAALLVCSSLFKPGAEAGFAYCSSTIEIHLLDVFMVNANDGWAVGFYGVILHWNGTDWSLARGPEDTFTYLQSVCMADANNGWAVGYEGRIMHWNGTVWGIIASPTRQNLRSVFMLNASEAWAVGDSGTMIHWNGVTWNTIASPTEKNLISAFMVSTNDSWAVGDTIVHWNGKVWSTVPSSIDTRFFSVFMINSDDGWAGGREGIIIHWNGTAWNTVPTPSSNYIYSIFMVNSHDGWAVGYYGEEMMHWNGTAWNLVTGPQAFSLASVFMVNASDGWAVGNWGMILRWSGTEWVVFHIHDVAIVTVNASKTIVCEGYTSRINVTAQNHGEATETFNVTLCANTTAIETREVTLVSGTSTIIAFTLNTTGFEKYRNCTLSAFAHAIQGETDLEDNTFSDGSVIVTMVGDIVPDREVNIKDVGAVARAFGSHLGHERWNANADINDDGQVNIKDIEILSNLLGLSYDERSFGVSTMINDDGVGWYPVVAADGVGSVYAAWQNHVSTQEGTYNFHTQVFFAYSHDYGRTWSEEIIVNDNASESVGCSTPSIAVDRLNGYVYIAWEDNRTGRTNIYFDKSTDRGKSFGNDTKINDDNGCVFSPMGMYVVNLATGNDSRIYVAWEDRRTNPTAYRPEIFIACSTDYGATFGPNVVVNPPDDISSHRFPWIGVNESGVVYVAYTKSNSTHVHCYVARSLDVGISFQAPVKVNDVATSYYIGKKEVAVSRSGKVHVVWTDSRAGSGGNQYWDIYIATSLNGGLSFGPNVRINDDPLGPIGQNTTQGTPSFAIDSSEGIHVVWEDFRNYGLIPNNTREIYYSYSNNGLNFSKNLIVNNLANATMWNCADPNVDIDSNDNLYIVWTDTPYVVWTDTPYEFGDFRNYFAFSPRTQAQNPHDLQITNLTTCKTVVGKGFNLHIKVTILNQGNNTELFNVTAYANTIAIDTLTNITLTIRNSTTVTFTWNTTSVAEDNYTISAHAYPVLGETDLEDNTFSDGTVTVTIVGDIVPDKKVDMKDVGAVARAFGSDLGHENWNANADVNDDEKIDIKDIFIVAKNFGRTAWLVPL